MFSKDVHLSADDRYVYENIAQEFEDSRDWRRKLELSQRLEKIVKAICDLPQFGENPTRTEDGRIISGMKQNDIIEHVAWLKRWDYWHEQSRRLRILVHYE